MSNEVFKQCKILILDAFLIAGDGVHDDGTRYDAWLTFWDEYFKAVNSTGFLIPIVYAFGNHDGKSKYKW